MEDKIIDLESKLSFQQQTINALNEVITDQQIQLNQLREALRLINLHLQIVTESGIESAIETGIESGASEKEPPPPHY